MERRLLSLRIDPAQNYGIMVVTDVFTRRLIGFGVAPADLDGPVICWMFNRAIAKQTPPKYLSTDNDLSTVSLSSVACEPPYTGS